MISPPSGARVYLVTAPCDMRKGINGLAGQVQSVLRTDPYSGALFLFRGKAGDQLKILAWDTPLRRGPPCVAAGVFDPELLNPVIRLVV